MKKALISLLLIAAVLSGAVATTLAWYANGQMLEFGFRGSVVTQYFARGTGTKEDPYILNEAIHVYNLSWLQYMGILNSETNEAGQIKQQYFEVEADIDMTGWIIPPIGTQEHPFVGNFNGGAHTITGATISNIMGQGEIENRPLSVTDLGQSASIVGFFGVVGDMTGTLDLSDDSKETAVANKVNAVYNLLLDGITVRTETNESLIGLLAGYVNGSVSHVGVDNARIEIGENVAPLQLENFDALAALQAVSLYSLIGAYDLGNVVWEQLPSGSNTGLTGGAGESGFGDSINMVDLSKRLTYMGTEILKNGKTYPLAVSAGTLMNYALSSDISAIPDGSFLPLNVDTATMFADEDKTTYGENLKTTAWYHEAGRNEEKINSSNTGYIVGAGRDSSAWIIPRTYYLSTTKDYGGIYKSVGTSGNESQTFSRANFDILTIDKDGKTWIIKDATNANSTTYLHTQYASAEKDAASFRRFSDVITGFSEKMDGSNLVHGFRFNANATRGLSLVSAENGKQTFAEITNDHTVSLYGQSYPEYALAKGAVNFTLKSEGYITAVAGTYKQKSDSTDDHTLFSLYQVERSADKKQIISTVEINKIYVQYGADGKILKDKIKYNDVSGEVDAEAYVLAYDAEKMNKMTEKFAAYYFEIPVAAGDYVIGANMNDDAGAYLLYLDIGANGDEFQVGGGGTTPTEPAHRIEGVNFVDAETIEKVTDSNGDATWPIQNYSMVTYRITIADSAYDQESHSATHTGMDAEFRRAADGSMEYGINNTGQFAIVQHTDDAGLVATVTVPPARKREE